MNEEGTEEKTAKETEEKSETVETKANDVE